MSLQEAIESVKKDFCGDCVGCDADLIPTGEREYYCGITELAKYAKANETLTVEDAPVVHRGWILSSTSIQCPECKTVYEIDMYSPICAETAHYCPNCGVKMD